MSRLRALTLTVPALVAGSLLLASSALADPPLVTQIASQPIKVSPEQLREDLFVAGDIVRLSDPASTESLVVERVLQQLYAYDPGLSPSTAADDINGLTSAASVPAGATSLDESANDRIEQVLVALEQTNPTGLVGSALGVLVRQAINQAPETGLGTDPGAQTAYGDNTDSLVIGGSFDPMTVLSQSAALGHSNSDFAQARDELWRAASGESITASTQQLLSGAAALQNNSGVKALVALRNSSGAINTTAGHITGAASNPAPNTLQATIADLQSQNGAAISGQTSDVRPAAQADETAATIDDLTLTSGTKGKVSTYGNVAEAAVGALGKIAQAYSAYNLGQMGAAALTGNVVAAAASMLPSVLEAFGVTKSPDEVILEQLQALSQQIQQFQQQVNTRFDQVDGELDGVLTGVAGLSTQLSSLQSDVSHLASNITGIYDHLVTLQNSVDSLQANIYQALANVDSGNLRAQIEAALNYQTRNGSPLPQSNFNGAATYLDNFVTFTAWHSPEVNGDSPSYLPQDVVTQLKAGVPSNMDYLDELPFQRGWLSQTLSGSTGSNPELDNPDDWAMASRAYSTLLVQNPNLVTDSYRQLVGDFSSQGSKLAAMISAIGASDTTSGTGSTLFNDLLCSYRSIATGYSTGCPNDTLATGPTVLQSLTAEEQDILGQLPGYDQGQITPSYKLQGATSGSTLDPWGGNQQNTDLDRLYPTLHQQIPECTRETPTQLSYTRWDSATAAPTDMGSISIPTGVTPSAAQVPVQYELADRLGVGSLAPCWMGSAMWITIVWMFTPNDPTGFHYSTVPVGSLRVSSPANSNNGANGCGNTQYTGAGHWSSCNLNTPAQITNYWNGQTVEVSAPEGDSADFDEIIGCGHDMYTFSPGNTQCVPFEYKTQNDNAADGVVDSGLVNVQQGVYSSMINAIQSGNSTAATNLQASLRLLDGSLSLLRDYASLGLTGFLRSDPTLSGLLVGSGSLYDSSRIVAAYNDAISSPPTDDATTTTIATALGNSAGAGDLPDAFQQALAQDFANTSSGSGSGPLGLANPLIAEVSDRLALTESAVSQGPAVAIRAPATGSVLSSSRTPVLGGTAGSSIEDQTTVHVAIFTTRNTGGSPAQSFTVHEARGAWSAAVPHPLANGVYTATAIQADRDGRVGRSDAVTFTVHYVPPPVPAASVTRPTTSPGHGVTFTVSCRNAPCKIIVLLTRSGTQTAIGSASFTVPAGRRSTRTVGLNSAGRNLLARHRQLSTRVVIKLEPTKTLSDTTLTLRPASR